MEVLIALFGVVAIMFVEEYWRRSRIKRDKAFMKDFSRYIHGDDDQR